MDLPVVLPLGLCTVILLLVFVLARLVSNAKKRETLKRLGLPAGAKLTLEQASALRAFENTDMKLQKTYPGMTAKQRQVIATDVLRDRGVLPKRRRPSNSSSSSP